MTAGDRREAVIGVLDRSLHPTASMRPHKASQRSSSGRLRKQNLSLHASFDFLAPRSSTWHPQRWSLLNVVNLNNAQTWFDASTCGGWHDRKRGTECGMLQALREMGGLIVSLSTSPILISLNSFIDITGIHRQLPCSTPPKLFKTNISPSNTIAFAVLPTMPPQSNAPRYETQLSRQAATRCMMI